MSSTFLIFPRPGWFFLTTFGRALILQEIKIMIARKGAFLYRANPVFSTEKLSISRTDIMVFSTRPLFVRENTGILCLFYR
jgi:hypothetical protein